MRDFADGGGGDGAGAGAATGGVWGRGGVLPMCCQLPVLPMWGL